MTHQEFYSQLKLEMDVHLNSDHFHRYSMFVDNNPTLFDSAPEVHNIHIIHHDTFVLEIESVKYRYLCFFNIFFCIANSCA